jgi:hypothetical protein
MSPHSTITPRVSKISSKIIFSPTNHTLRHGNATPFSSPLRKVRRSQTPNHFLPPLAAKGRRFSPQTNFWDTKRIARKSITRITPWAKRESAMYRREAEGQAPETTARGGTSTSGSLAPMGRPSLPGPSTLPGGPLSCASESCASGSGCVFLVAGLQPPMGDSGTRSDCVATMDMLNDMFQRQAHAACQTAVALAHTPTLFTLTLTLAPTLTRREGSSLSCTSARKMRAPSRPCRSRRRRRRSR